MENNAAAHLAVNPRGKVPAMRDGAFTLYASVAILQYLDRKDPQPPLFARTAEESGLVLRRVLELIFYVDPILDRLCPPIPAVAAWVKLMEALPGYERTYPPHRR